MKAQNPEQYRGVRVKTIYKAREEAVTQQMYKNAKEGLIPQWEELTDEDTAQMDTETIFQDGLHQVTIPFPVDEFPCLQTMTGREALEYARMICRREGWKDNYKNLLAVFNNLSMEID